MLKQLIARLRRKSSREPRPASRAQGLLEFAFILPLLLLFILGTIEAGRMLAIYSQISSGAKQAARYGSVAGDSDGSTAGEQPFYLDCDGMRATAKSAAALLGLENSHIHIRYDKGAAGTEIGACGVNDPTPVLSETIDDGYRVVISVTQTYRPLVPIVPIPDLPMTFVAARTIFTIIQGPTNTPRPDPDLAISKKDSQDPVLPSGTFSYTVVVTNTSSETARGTIVTETLPSTVTNVTYTSDPRWTCQHTNPLPTNPIICENDFFSPGAHTVLTITVRAPASSGFIHNVARVAYDETDPITDNNVYTETTNVIQAVDLLVTKTDAVDPVGAGGLLTYTLNVQNLGSVAATTIYLTDTLPAGATYNSHSAASGSFTWNCGMILGEFRCQGTGGSGIGVGATAPALTLVVNVPGPGALPPGNVITNFVDATAQLVDPDLTNSIGISQTTTILSDADLEIAKTDGPDPVAPDANLTYVLRVTNRGPSIAENVTVVDTLDAALVGRNFTTNGADWTCSPANGTVPANRQIQCTFDRALADEEQSPDLSIIVQVPSSEGITLFNSATASSDQSDPDPADNSVGPIDTTVFNCTPGQISTSASSFTASVDVHDLAHVQADNGSPSQVRLVVTVKDDCNNLMSGVPVTVNFDGGAIGSITATSGSTDGGGQFVTFARSGTVGTATFVATIGSPAQTLAPRPQATYVCNSVFVVNFPDNKTIEIGYQNDTSIARRLERVIVTFTQGQGQKLDRITIGGTTVWDGNSNSGVTIGVGGDAWSGGTDSVRTISNGLGGQVGVRYIFSNNLPTSGSTETYTFNASWSDTGSPGSYVCSVSHAVTRP